MRRWLRFAKVLVLAGLPCAAAAQPVGSEFQINTYTTGDQMTYSVASSSLVAADSHGNAVVVWESHNFQDGSAAGIFGQRYDSRGVTQGVEFQVNSFTLGDQSRSSIAAADDGAFVVVWQSRNQDGSDYGIFGQRYDREGVAQGAEFRVNSYTTDAQQDPAVASDASGNYIVVWHTMDVAVHSIGIFAQRYDSAGVRLGGEFRVSSYTTSGQRFADVAADGSGNFVVVWSGQDGFGYGIFGQRFDSTGVPLGSEFQVNSYTTAVQAVPSVASDASGNFVVVWASTGQDGSLDGIFGQRYDSAGAALGGEFRVNSYTPNTQRGPSVASDASGNFVVVWHSYGQDGGVVGVFGQRYDGAGAARGDEFLVNSYTRGWQVWASVGATGTNEFVVAWTSVPGQDSVHGSQDGDGAGVFGRRFGRER
jgi:hypothetical protein